MTNESQATRDQQVVPIETTLLRITVVFRVIGALWLVFLSVVTLVTEESRVDPSLRTGLIASAIGIAVFWTTVTVALAYRSPTVLASTWFLVVDVGLAAWVALIPSLVASDSFFAGGYRFRLRSWQPPPMGWEQRR